MFTPSFAALLLVVILHGAAAAPTVNALAGTGSAGSANGAGAAATFSSPWGVVAASSGLLFVSDSAIGGGRLRTVNATDGTTGTLAITPPSGFRPTGLALDSTGNLLYVADFFNENILLVNIANPSWSVFAGSPTGVSGSINGQGTNARFYSPLGLALSPSGLLFVADSANNQIRSISTIGVVALFAGSSATGSTLPPEDGPATSANFAAPAALAIDAANNLYVADRGNNLIRLISGGTVSTLAGKSQGFADGVFNAAFFHNPQGLVLDASGLTLYVSDSANNRLRSIDIATKNVTTIAGTGVSGNINGIGNAAALNAPYGITSFNGALFFADNVGNRIRSVSGLVSTPAVLPSATPSVTRTVTPSVTPTQGGATPPVTPSPTVTPSGTPSGTPSRGFTTPSATPSTTPSSTGSPTGTPSGTLSGTASRGANSPSTTPSSTPSSTVSPTGTPSAPVTPSGSPSAPVTPSGSPSPTGTSSVTPSAPGTPPSTPSPTGTSSVTPSARGTPLNTPSPTGTPSFTSSSSRTRSVSRTRGFNATCPGAGCNVASANVALAGGAIIGIIVGVLVVLIALPIVIIVFCCGGFAVACAASRRKAPLSSSPTVLVQMPAAVSPQTQSLELVPPQQQQVSYVQQPQQAAYLQQQQQAALVQQQEQQQLVAYGQPQQQAAYIEPQQVAYVEPQPMAYVEPQQVAYLQQQPQQSVEVSFGGMGMSASGRFLPPGWQMHGPDAEGDVWYTDASGESHWELP